MFETLVVGMTAIAQEALTMDMEEERKAAPTAAEVNAIKDPLAKAPEEDPALVTRDGTAVEEQGSHPERH